MNSEQKQSTSSEDREIGVCPSHTKFKLVMVGLALANTVLLVSPQELITYLHYICEMEEALPQGSTQEKEP